MKIISYLLILFVYTKLMKNVNGQGFPFKNQIRKVVSPLVEQMLQNAETESCCGICTVHKFTHKMCIIRNLSAFLLLHFILVSNVNSSSEISGKTKVDIEEDELPSFLEHCGTPEEIEGDLRTKIPWVAGIYIRDNENSPFRYYITGSVIGPTTVLTLLGGAFGAPPRSSKNAKYNLPRPENIIVGVGLKSTRLDEADEHTQILQVNFIAPNQVVDNDQFHFAVLHLAPPGISFDTPWKKSVCLPPIDIGTTVSPYDGWEIFIGGFSSPMRKGGLPLTRIPFKTGEEDYCERSFAYYYKSKNASHVYCAKIRAAEVNEDPCISHGSPQSIAIELGSTVKHFSGGLIALIPRKNRGTCNRNTTYFLANALNHIYWIYYNLGCSPNKYACRDSTCIDLWKVCDLHKDCPEGEDEDGVLCEAINRCPSNTIQCGGFHSSKCIEKDKICDGFSDCPYGNDENEKYCSQQKKITSLAVRRSVVCHKPPLSEGVSVKCVDEFGEQIDCNSAFLGTRATLNCNKFYISKYRFSTLTMKCGSDGLWYPYRVFACDPDCGIVQKTQRYIAQGQNVKRENDYPWYAALFKKQINEDDPHKSGYKFACGGTLVDAYAVITAAHCLPDAHDDQFTKTHYKVILSPVTSIYEENLNIPNVQVREIIKYNIPPTYNTRTLISDIAILHLNQSVEFGSFVRPVCLLEPRAPDVPLEGAKGQVVGFGFNEDNVLSENLKFAELPVIERNECEKSLGREISKKSFCAGFKNGTRVCQGDSGGGLIFPDSSRSKYIIKGVVSHGEPSKDLNTKCGAENYSVFTHVDSFSDWILDILENIDRSL